MGKAAFIAATRHARQHVVMASTDRIMFDAPVRVGDLIECVASIARIGRASMSVAVDLIHEDALSGQRRTAVRGTFEMVAVDANGQPTPISVSRHSNEVQEEAIT
jgi:acyl-CoA hydrolase